MGGGDSRECDGDQWVEGAAGSVMDVDMVTRVEGTAGSVMVTSGWRGQQGVGW